MFIAPIDLPRPLTEDPGGLRGKRCGFQVLVNVGSACEHYCVRQVSWQIKLQFQMA